VQDGLQVREQNRKEKVKGEWAGARQLAQEGFCRVKTFSFSNLFFSNSRFESNSNRIRIRMEFYSNPKPKHSINSK
jgi:hypothetical protein